ncbi:PepSY domain-containing protein [Catenuloplanes japonicus]|uniref:PepSY domain-containing protein n=1 Tax=Catenuloplanes japonicus TaxID=33876 RepID=UPI000526D8D7|nr:PepSY domain-containing protein [Catenuloplanes japonicus]
MKRTKMIAVAVGAAAVLGFGGTAWAASMSDDGRATTGLGTAATPSSTPSFDDSTGRPSSPSSAPSWDDSSASPSSSASTSSSSPGSAVSREEAVAIAQAYLGQGTVREVESDDVRNIPTWKVEFNTDGGRREINVDKATGAVISDEFDDRSGGHGGDDDSGRHGGDDNGRHGGDDDNSGHGRHGD